MLCDVISASPETPDGIVIPNRSSSSAALYSDDGPTATVLQYFERKLTAHKNSCSPPPNVRSQGFLQKAECLTEEVKGAWAMPLSRWRSVPQRFLKSRWLRGMCRQKYAETSRLPPPLCIT